MNDINKRWVITGSIWICVISLFLMNMHILNTIYLDKEQQLNDQIDINFLNRNYTNINDILEKREKYYHHTESLQLGLLLIKNELNDLALKQDLMEITTETASTQTQGGIVSIKLSCSGSIDNMLKFLDVVQNKFLFLNVTKTVILCDDTKKQIYLNTMFTYMYKLSSL